MQARACFTVVFFALAAPAELRAHPLQAAPLDHAHVPAFEQFYLPEDDDAFLSEGGLLLLAELNCAACHPAPEAWQGFIGPKPGPDLSTVGSRLDMDALWRFIRSPQHRKPGTQMPGLFAGNEEADPDTIEAIATYLASLIAKDEMPALPAGDAGRGRLLYHQVGCVACHEPATDYRPASLAPDAEVEAPGLPSSPIALADDYSQTGLAKFLHDPLKLRPASRMPSQHLTAQEAADIAAYLHVGRVPNSFAERAVLRLAPANREQGRVAFFEQRCAACHETGETLPDPASLSPLTELNPGSGTDCLSGARRSGVPNYGLSPLQIRALRLALQRVKNHAPPTDAAHRLNHQLSRFNCFACHDSDGRGGPEIARAPYFTDVRPDRPNDDLAQLPPSLDGIQQRLGAEDLRRRLLEPHSPPKAFHVRMPRFQPGSVRALLEALSVDAASERQR